MIIIIIIIYVWICENGVRENFTPTAFSCDFGLSVLFPPKKEYQPFSSCTLLSSVIYSFPSVFHHLKSVIFIVSKIVKFRSLAHLVQKNEIFINTVFIGLVMYEMRPNHNGLLCLKVLCIVLIF